VSGSFERFIAILIEHFGGAFPVWLAPEQVRVIPIAIDYNEHAQALVTRLKAHGIRATLDARNETLNYRVREGEVEKVPYMCVIGRREAEEHTVALRARGGGKKQDILSQDAFLERVLEEVRTRALPVVAEKAPVAEGDA
jgi:threonyl-tRNA synthetase